MLLPGVGEREPADADRGQHHRGGIGLHRAREIGRELAVALAPTLQHPVNHLPR
jgi:hypothetical protein